MPAPIAVQITLNSKFARELAIKWIAQAPTGHRVLFKATLHHITTHHATAQQLDK